MLTRNNDTFTWLDYNRRSDEKSPLLVMLHGYGSNEKDLLGLAHSLDARLRVVSVRAPLVLGPEMYGWFPIDFTPGGITVDREAARQVADKLAAFLENLIEKLQPVGGKTFLMGFSQGTVMSYFTAFRNPALLHGVLALSGQLPDSRPEADTLPTGLADVPFLVQHGLFDDVLPIDRGRQADAWLRDKISDYTYREYPMAHQIDQESLDFMASWLSERIDRALS
ncbi:alpha/beta hydrolase [Chlorobaculum sp. 24CR]|uniref:alpha/beta hydrolase n=1 Tax=Chlorobaculum sp. 24CR TaxID=2508878 RepID=UPI001430618E|nr:alpha/beta fold hydrolase [Chlorobaculum sp. 24CR]